MELKYAIRKFLRTTGTSDSVEELAEMFIIPFYRSIEGLGVSPEAAIDLFFNEENRKFFYARAKKPFRMPGVYVDPKKEGAVINGNRTIDEGKVMMFVIDLKDDTSKVTVRARDRFDEFVLSTREMEVVKGLVDVIS